MGESTFNPRMTMQTVIDDARQLQDALGLPAAVHVGESGGAPYAACFAATHPRRCAALLLLAGLAATHGSDGARLRRGLNSMDRICFNIGAVAGPLNRFIKLAADVSRCCCCELMAGHCCRCELMAGCCCRCRRLAAPPTPAGILLLDAPHAPSCNPPTPAPRPRPAAHAGQCQAWRGRQPGPLRRLVPCGQRRRQGVDCVLHAGVARSLQAPQ